MRLGAGRQLRRNLTILAVLAVAYSLAALVVTNSYYQLILTLVPVWALFGVSWNILSGYGGQLSFGHAAFFGIGAYTVTLAMIYWSLSPWLGIPLGMVIGGLAALAIGTPTFRLRGHYFALSMLAYPLAILYVLQYLGFQEVSMPMHRDHPVAFMEFSQPRIYTLIAVGLLVGGVVISLVIESSRFGLALLAIRQNELAAEAAGINARLWKMRSLVVSGMMAAVAGGFYARVLLVVTPDSVFGMLVSAQAVVVTLFGGVASVWGPVIGAAILVPLAETLQAELGTYLPGIQGVIYGIAIIAIMLLSPDGLYWTIRDRWFAAKTPTPIPDVVATPPPPHRTSVRADTPLLFVENVSRTFGGLKAVSEVSFAVAEGEILGIIGPNGAGKTTLFNLLNGFLPPDTGKVVFAGRELIGLKPNRICRLGVGRTFQVVRAFPRLSVLNNVVVGAYATTTNDPDAFAAASAALAQVGLIGRSDAIAGGLTNKELRLMELARALAGRPRLLLMDEPLAGLASQEIEDMLAVIRALAAQGMTVVIIEHTMRAMVRLAERFVVLDHGAILAVGQPSEIINDEGVIEAYLGKKWAAIRARG